MRARIATWSAAAGGIIVLAWSSGGYFPPEWGLVTLGFLLASLGVVLLADRIEIGVSGVVVLAALAGFGLWQLASIAWSASPGVPVTEAERTLLYLTAAAALLLCLRPATVPALLEGVVAGATVVAVYALGTRLAPGSLGGAYDPSSGYQLAKPIGYWNALGLLAVFGIVLAAGIALRRDGVRASLAAAAAVPLVACQYFTFSRGSLVALFAALVVLVLLAQDRLRAIVLLGLFLVLPFLGVFLASRSHALTAAGATLQTAQREGYRLAWQLALLAVIAAVAQVAARRVATHVAVGATARGRIMLGMTGLVLFLGLVGLARSGGPRAVVDRARAAFVAEPPATAEGLDRRLLSASGNGRSAYWRVAARMVERGPLLGGGAGSFTRAWAAERPVANEARDAHNLYLESLAELGPVGLALLLLVLAVPFVILRRVWRDPSAPAAAGVLVAFILHAAIDWDWEIPLVTLIPLGCLAALLVLDPRRRVLELSGARRVGAAAVCSALVAIALVVHVGNRAAADALDALAADDPDRAAASAERARGWMPWSSEGDQLLGEALSVGGDEAAARVVLRRAARRDPGEWSIWYDLAGVATGTERVRALTRARELNPLSVELPAPAAETETESS